MPEEHIAIIGKRQVWGGEEPFGISAVDRRQHLYAIGQTGSGKSTLLRNLILQDIEAGRGVGLIDPHGDLAEAILDHIPRWRTDHVVYFNPGDEAFPFAFNLLNSAPSAARHLVASGLVTALKNVFHDSWGPRLEYILYQCLAALLECRNTSILGIQRMLMDDTYRGWVVKQVKDPILKAYWVEEFAGYDNRFMREAIAPIQNKVGQLLTPPIRNILSQVRSKFDPAFVMDHGRIFIANLSKGRLGEEKANLMGSMLITQFQLAAMARATMPEEQRQDFSLYIDEFHNFSTDSFASILSESRKYRLSLLLFHQHLDQLTEPVRNAVFGNCGTLISFRVGEGNAAILAREFGKVYEPGHFSSLDNHEVCVRLMQQGRQLQAFTAKTLPPIGIRYGHRENLIRRSRERYAKPRHVVEDRIHRWMHRDMA